MRKIAQERLAGLKGSAAALMTAKKLGAAVLAAMVMALAACDNGAGGPGAPHTPPQGEQGDDGKTLEYEKFEGIEKITSGSQYPKTLKDVLDKAAFHIVYETKYENEDAFRRTKNVSYARLDKDIKDGLTFRFASNDIDTTYSFPEDAREVSVQIIHGGKAYEVGPFSNGNYKSQEGQQPSTGKSTTDLLKEILTEAKYNEISGKLSSGNITLTAQTIKAVGDNFSVLENDAKNGSLKDTNNNVVEDNKEVFVARNEGKIVITKSGDVYSLDSYSIPVTFTGEFNLDEITLPTNNGKGNFDNATLKGANKITIDKLNQIRGSSLPTLSFNNISGWSSEIDIYNLYKAYSSNLGKLVLSGDVGGNINGKEISGNDKYTLFEKDGNEVKKATDDTIKSLTADALVQMTNQLNIHYFKNMIISGDATNEIEVEWGLTNIVFEEDMSNIKIVSNSIMKGIVYFKDKPYNNAGTWTNDEVFGMLKLDNLKGVSSENFKIGFTNNSSSVLDVRGVDTNFLKQYNDKPLLVIGGGNVHAIYFSDDFKELNNQEDINKLTYKFANKNVAGVFNIYLGDKRVHGYSYDSNEYQAASKTPRKLKEFEFLGNNSTFDKSAKETYEGNFEGLEEKELNSLNKDFDKLLAQNNKRIEFIDPETQKVIFSVINDRQYNA